MITNGDGTEIATDRSILRVTGGCDDPGPLCNGPLNRLVANPAGTTGDQNSLAGDRTITHNAAMSRHGRYAKAGTYVKTGRVG